MFRITTLFFLVLSASAFAQRGSVSGSLSDIDGNPVSYANVALYQAADSALYKVDVSGEDGKFRLLDIDAGQYYLNASFIGIGEITKTGISVADGNTDIGNIQLEQSAVALDVASVSVERPLVEVQPDRTVFNVEGTINNTGDNALQLMRKAPGVTVDNNDNINVLGRAGVMVYVDGKRLPLGGEDLANYLKNLPSDQIDRIDIISNPGAKYDAEGNAGYH